MSGALFQHCLWCLYLVSFLNAFPSLRLPPSPAGVCRGGGSDACGPLPQPTHQVLHEGDAGGGLCTGKGGSEAWWLKGGGSG